MLVLVVPSDRAALLMGSGGGIEVLQRMSAATGARIHVPLPAVLTPAAPSAAARGGAPAAASGAAVGRPICAVTFEGSVAVVQAALAHAVAVLIPAAMRTALQEFTIPGASALCRTPPPCRRRGGPFHVPALLLAHPTAATHAHTPPLQALPSALSLEQRASTSPPYSQAHPCGSM